MPVVDANYLLSGQVTKDKKAKAAQAAAANPSLDAGYAEDQELQRKARAQALGMADASQQMATDLSGARAQALQGFDQAGAAGANSLLRGGAKAMAAAQGAGVSGGGLFASNLQAGLETGGAQADFAGQLAKARGAFGFDSSAQVGEANKAAAADAFGATEIQRKIGNEAGNRAKATAVYNTKKSEIIEKHKHWYGDDNEMMAQELRDYALTEPDPTLRQQIIAEAANIENGLDV